VTGEGSAAGANTAAGTSTAAAGANTAGVSTAQAEAWIDRWDRQQQFYMPDREERFTALIDAVAEAAGRPDPLVLDLGCGPGSLSSRLLDQIPAATVVAIDADPVLLALGRAAQPGRSALRFADADLRVPGWTAALGLVRPADAAVSTTALHWLPERELRAMYAEVATVLRPGGLLLNGDHLHDDEKVAPVLARLGDAIIEREEQRRYPGGHPEDWSQWWTAVLADPALAAPVAERSRRRYNSDHGSESRLLQTHVAALESAGFTEIGTLWQRGSNRLLCAILGSPEAG
jgi:SAM-dependent methyltransferase